MSVARLYSIFVFNVLLIPHPNSETTSIPTNPRTTRPVGYAFVDVSTPTEAERAVTELNGKTIMDRKVSVQLARKPEEPTTNGEENGAKKSSRPRRGLLRGRGRGRGSRRGGRGGRVSHCPLLL